MLRSITLCPSSVLIGFGSLALACASEDPDTTNGMMPIDTSTTSTLSPTSSVPAMPTTTGMPTSSVPAMPTTTGMPTSSVPAMPTTTGMPPTTVPTVDPDAPPAKPWADIYFLINNSCARLICHVPPPGGASTLDLSDARNDLHMMLMNTTVLQCDGDPLVTPGDPTKSALIKLVKKECGGFVMPQDCLPADATCLPQLDIDDLSNWIAQGAAGPMPAP